MKVDFKNIARNTINGLTNIGCEARHFVKNSKIVSKDKLDEFVKSDSVKSKIDLIKDSNVAKQVKEYGISKDTLFGAGIVLVALGLATKAVLGIKNKIQELRKNG